MTVWTDFNDAVSALEDRLPSEGQSIATPAAPDLEQIKSFLAVAFSYCEGLIPVRGFVDQGQGLTTRPHNIWIPADAAAPRLVPFRERVMEIGEDEPAPSREQQEDRVAEPVRKQAQQPLGAVRRKPAEELEEQELHGDVPRPVVRPAERFRVRRPWPRPCACPRHPSSGPRRRPAALPPPPPPRA